MKKTKGVSSLLQTRTAFLVALIVLIAALVLSVVFAVNLGTMDISALDIFKVVLYKLFGVGDASQYGSGPVADVVWFVRLPRIVLAIAVGMGLSVTGVVMQAIVKNPLADPYILGVSSGASLGATLALMLGVGTVFGGNFVGVTAFLGAFAVSFAVLLLAGAGGRANTTKLLLAGMALSAVCSAFSNFVVYVTDNKDALKSVSYWLMGSLAGADWSEIAVILPLILISTVFFWTQCRTLNLMLLGDETSVTLGTDLHRRRQIYLLISAAMVGFVVYASGMIGFVGLVVPHAVRMLFGTDHKKLIPLSALVGAVFLIWADVLCRIIIQGTELPIGILTSMIGAPCFIYLMIRRRYGFGGKD